jgi:hypothetical protein
MRFLGSKEIGVEARTSIIGHIFRQPAFKLCNKVTEVDSEEPQIILSSMISTRRRPRSILLIPTCRKERRLAN